MISKLIPIYFRENFVRLIGNLSKMNKYTIKTLQTFFKYRDGFFEKCGESLAAFKQGIENPCENICQI